MKKLFFGTLLIECAYKQQSTKYIELKSFVDVSVHIFPHKFLNSCKDVIRSADLVLRRKPKVQSSVFVTDARQKVHQLLLPTNFSTIVLSVNLLYLFVDPQFQTLCDVFNAKSSVITRKTIIIIPFAQSALKPTTTATIARQMYVVSIVMDSSFLF